MRFIIYGAGGIGGSLGARLHLAGEDVVLIARGEHASVLQSEGLHFISPRQNQVLRIPTVVHPREIEFRSNDVVILCMKGQHTEGALRDLYQHAPDSISVVCCQNGVANERMAVRRFGNVYGMVVLVPAEHLKPGEVINFADSKAGMLDAGRYPVGVDAEIEKITNAVDQAGFTSIPQARIMSYKHSKLLGNLNNAVQAVTGVGSRELSRKLREEALACYESADIECTSYEENMRRREKIQGGPVPGHERHGGSSLQSMMRQTGDIEADYLNGEIVQLGRLHGIQTPANAIVQRVANKVVREGLSIGSISIEDLERMVEDENTGSTTESIA